MKPVLMRHVEPVNESFKSWKNEKPYLHNPWHYHPEFEITFITKGHGMLFIGDRVISYADESLVLIGPNLPHEWRSTIKEDPDNYSQSFAVHFKVDSLGKDLYTLPEMILINTLLDQAKQGIAVHDIEAKAKVKEKLATLIQTHGVERISILLSILHCLSIAQDTEFLSSTSFVNSIQNDHDNRINQIYKYAMINFKGKLSIEEIAEQISMTPTSFCRFFKQRTNKSFIQYVNEIRVGYACKLLFEQDLNISQIAYECGFDNLSHFNKQFKKIKNTSPSIFVKDFKKR